MAETALPEINGHRIYMPDARAFADIFEAFALNTEKGYGQPRKPAFPPYVHHFIDKQFPRRGNGPMRDVRTYMHIGPHLSFRSASYAYGDCKLTAAALELLLRLVLNIEYDTISFEVIEWDDGRALVVAKHGKILGDYWLAIIDAATIPAEVRRTA